MCEKSGGGCISAAQVKISVPPGAAHAFKTACKANDTSMTAVISGFMSQYSKDVMQKGEYAPNLSTRRQRKAAVQAIIYQLERIRDNEEHYRDNIPPNLQGGSAYEAADQCISTLDETLDLLASAY